MMSPGTTGYTEPGRGPRAGSPAAPGGHPGGSWTRSCDAPTIRPRPGDGGGRHAAR
ncbi:hypothetical protein QJS66_05725 [Kocuria rhizophila]|nr:hypothetical protein QJS66_05725 [Kocuria rhizophila]